MRSFILLLGIAFVGLVGWAFAAGDFFAEGRQIWSMPWGRVTLIDLYLGFFLFSLFVFWVEEQKKVAVAVTVSLMIFGNMVAALYLAWRFKAVREKLKKGEP